MYKVLQKTTRVKVEAKVEMGKLIVEPEIIISRYIYIFL